MHRNARLAPLGRRTLVERVLSGRPAAHVAAEMGVSRATAYKWVRRFRAGGEAALEDRSSRPRRSPRRTPATLESAICTLRRQRKFGPLRIGHEIGVVPSTARRVLARPALP